jgi:hypothetical protein
VRFRQRRSLNVIGERAGGRLPRELHASSVGGLNVNVGEQAGLISMKVTGHDLDPVLSRREAFVRESARSFREAFVERHPVAGLHVQILVASLRKHRPIVVQRDLLALGGNNLIKPRLKGQRVVDRERKMVGSALIPGAVEGIGDLDTQPDCS